MNTPEEHVEYVLKNILQYVSLQAISIGGFSFHDSNAEQRSCSTFRSFQSRKIFFMAHKYGTHTLMRALSLHCRYCLLIVFLVTVRGSSTEICSSSSLVEAFKDRVSAISLVDGSHSIDSYTDPSFRKWWSLVSMSSSHAQQVAFSFRIFMPILLFLCYGKSLERCWICPIRGRRPCQGRLQARVWL